MENKAKNSKLASAAVTTYKKMQKNNLYKYVMWIFGVITLTIVRLVYASNGKERELKEEKSKIEKELGGNAFKNELREQVIKQLEKKNKFFDKNVSSTEFDKQVNKIVDSKYEEMLNDKLSSYNSKNEKLVNDFYSVFEQLLNNKIFFIFSFIFSLPMYVLLWIYANPYVKYIFERLIMLVFVMFGVTFLVFTILYISPSEPALNILGMEATQEEVDSFNTVYGLDKPYIEQLFLSFKRLATFDLGRSYVGNEEIAGDIIRKFPITLNLGIWSLIVALVIAIPAGIISAVKQYSAFDYILMFVALLGLSIPNFWLGLVLILNFSIKLHWLPATFQVGNWMAVIMPAVVLGTGMSANVARMTRSSMLEVKNQDYIMTARAKGLSQAKVTMKHILTNAMIPIVTVIGLQFGGVLGGASATEKVFNVNGIGTYIVDKQFLPDVPAVLAGVVYISVIISVSNLVVDILYTFIDPRMKTSIKNY